METGTVDQSTPTFVTDKVIYIRIHYFAHYQGHISFSGPVEAQANVNEDGME